MNSKEKKWIEVGYALFAAEGPNGLKIDRIAKSLNTSRSSFYHHFADMEIFKSQLFEYHIQRAEQIWEEAAKCQSMNPDFINLILTFKQDLWFNKQLRIHRHLPEYSVCIEKSHEPIERAFLSIWAKEFDLEQNLASAQMLLKLVVDNFYMRISEDSLSFDWLVNYLDEIVEMTKGIERK
ncbi:MAG: TetR/AcrR family transcriptional regulator [Flavobacteriales bacterium]|nr:TetR/AcrR family transcriptional regulator [Flavobacteriales bacterium]